MENIDTLIIGGGQGGLSLSYYLTQAGREHLVLEKAAQTAEAWRNHRWDSFTFVTPNWTFKLPGGEYDGAEPGGFMPKAEIVTRFERYVERYKLPVRYRTTASSVTGREGGKGFAVEADGHTWHARSVAIATGLFQHSKVPGFAGQIPPDVAQLTSDQYRNPQSLAEGAVLVVGSGQSGAQIAEDLYQSGRKVYLCTSTAPFLARRYRGRDMYEWVVMSGWANRTVEQLPSPQARFASNPLISGRNGGTAQNLHRFYRDGVTLLGHLRGVEGGCLQLAPDLQDTLRKNEQLGRNFLQFVEAYIEKNRVTTPLPEQEERLTDAFSAPEILSLDLRANHITTVIWSIGYAFDYSLVKFPIFDSAGFPITRAGVTRVPGLYFIGMPWMDGQKTGLLLGVGEAAAHLAEEITNLL